MSDWRHDMNDRDFAIAMLMPYWLTGATWPPEVVDALLEDHEDDARPVDSLFDGVYMRSCVDAVEQVRSSALRWESWAHYWPDPR